MAPRHPLPRRIIILGPQASGKGTQAELLGRWLRLPVVSMGDLLRHEVKRGSAIGQRIRRTLAAGRLVPPRVTDQLFRRWLESRAAQRGFVVDGFPRDQRQLQLIDRVTPIDLAIVFALSDRQAIERLKGRLVCQGCGRVYHIRFRPSRRGDRCQACGERLVLRNDDTPKPVRTRLRLYHRETEPVIETLGRRGLVLTVDAQPPIPVIARLLRQQLKRWPAQSFT